MKTSLRFVVPGVTIHLTYTYLWVALGIVWIVGVFIGNNILAIGEWKWWERVAVLLWPVALPVVLILKVLFAIFWPEY
jgi:hypothetical protein